ncbi:MAG: hypothetical protein QM503_11800 [Bacteroidota bacterium]
MYRRNINYMLVILFTIFTFTNGYSQYQNLGTANKVKVRENPWFAGGMIGGSFSNNGGSFEISPLVGYKVTEDFHVGSRITYIYSKYYGKSYNDFGGSLFARHRFLDFLFGHVEYEVLSVQYVNVNFEDERRTINSLFIGGGLFQSMGGRGFATIAILYNVLESEYSPYTNPVIRIGFGVGF